MTGDGYNATLVKRIDMTVRLAILQVRPDDGIPAFTAGQYTVLALRKDAPRIADATPEEPSDIPPDRLIKRAYSITSGSNAVDFLEFYVALMNSGALTPRLFALREGDRLFVGPRAKGLFTLDLAPADKNILMVATGTGLAPYMSMLRSHVLNTQNQPIAVLHGANYSWDLGYRGELESLRKTCPNFGYVPVVSRPEEDADWRGRTGLLPSWINTPDLDDACGFPVAPDKTNVFLCGNPAMIESALNILTGLNFTEGTRKEPGTIHVEKYW